MKVNEAKKMFFCPFCDLMVPKIRGNSRNSRTKSAPKFDLVRLPGRCGDMRAEASASVCGFLPKAATLRGASIKVNQGKKRINYMTRKGKIAGLPAFSGASAVARGIGETSQRGKPELSANAFHLSLFAHFRGKSSQVPLHEAFTRKIKVFRSNPVKASQTEKEGLTGVLPYTNQGFPYKRTDSPSASRTVSRV